MSEYIKSIEFTCFNKFTDSATQIPKDYPMNENSKRQISEWDENDMTIFMSNKISKHVHAWSMHKQNLVQIEALQMNNLWYKIRYLTQNAML